MLKFISILLAVIVAVNCDAPCTSCGSVIGSILTSAESIINGFEPIILNDVSICSRLIFTNITGLTPAGEACLITRPNNSISTQKLDVQVATVHVECHLLNDTIATNDSNSDVEIITLDIKDMKIFAVTDNDFDEGTANLTSIEIDQGNFTSTKLSLKGNTTLIEVGQLFVNNSFTSNVLGYISRFILSLFVDQLKDSPTIVEIISVLHCEVPE